MNVLEKRMPLRAGIAAAFVIAFLPCVGGSLVGLVAQSLAVYVCAWLGAIGIAATILMLRRKVLLRIDLSEPEGNTMALSVGVCFGGRVIYHKQWSDLAHLESRALNAADLAGWGGGRCHWLIGIAPNGTERCILGRGLDGIFQFSEKEIASVRDAWQTVAGGVK